MLVFRKQIEAKMDHDGEEEKDEEEEEEEESEEESENSSSYSSSEEEGTDEIYDYQYLLEDYKEIQEDWNAGNNSLTNRTNITSLDIGFSKPEGGTNVINLADDKLDVEKTDSVDKVTPQNSTQNSSIKTREAPVMKEIPVSMEIQNGDKTSLKPTPKPKKVKTTTDFYVEDIKNYDYFNDEPDNDSDRNNIEDNETPEVLNKPMYTFKAHERKPLPYLEYKDFLPILKADSVMLTYKGVKTMRKRWTHIELVCDYRKRKYEDATFKLVAARGLNIVSMH